MGYWCLETIFPPLTCHALLGSTVASSCWSTSSGCCCGCGCGCGSLLKETPCLNLSSPLDPEPSVKPEMMDLVSSSLALFFTSPLTTSVTTFELVDSIGCVKRSTSIHNLSKAPVKLIHYIWHCFPYRLFLFVKYLCVGIICYFRLKSVFWEGLLKLI